MTIVKLPLGFGSLKSRYNKTLVVNTSPRSFDSHILTGFNTILTLYSGLKNP
jgi:hypothetical protein